MNKVDQLLQGSIDMHCHGYPEFSIEAPVRFNDEEKIENMITNGMSGVVLKSHFWPTIDKVYYLKKLYPDFNIFSSITLNYSVGSAKHWIYSVEAALKQGAKVVYLPTWSSKNDISKNGVISILGKHLPSLNNLTADSGIYTIDSDGELQKEIYELLIMAKNNNIVIFTGHLSSTEVKKISQVAREISFDKLVFNHPDSKSVGAPLDDTIEIARNGTYLEFCALGIMPLVSRIKPKDIAKIIKTVGAEHCILTTDSFFEWDPNVAEMLRILIFSLLECGITENEITRMIKINPSKLLEL